MNKIFITFLLFTMSPPVFAQTRYGRNSSGGIIQDEEKMTQIELIENTPTKKFKKIAPIWAAGNSSFVSKQMESALDNAKKQAVKVGADAIIEFKVESQMAGNSSAFGNFGAASQKPIPVITGWAVKWE